MENTYWNNKGTHQDLVTKLQELVPAMGEVKGSGNRQLERFRKAANAYHDVYNNGGGNRDGSIRGFFGFGMSSARLTKYGPTGRYTTYDWDFVASKTEPAMDAIVLAAAKEQGLV